VRGALGGLERLFQLGDAICFDFQLLVQRSVLGPQGLQFGRHLSQTLSLQERAVLDLRVEEEVFSTSCFAGIDRKELSFSRID